MVTEALTDGATPSLSNYMQRLIGTDINPGDLSDQIFVRSGWLTMTSCLDACNALDFLAVVLITETTIMRH